MTCPMTPDVLQYISDLSATDKKSLSQKALKASEELGELSRVILPYDNAASTTHRFVERTAILEETVDLILCALSIAYDVGFNDHDIATMMKDKARYWDELQSRERAAPYPLPYEIHVTVTGEGGAVDLDRFREDCRAVGVKPLLIDMHNKTGGTVIMDTQTSSVVRGDNRSALDETNRIADGLAERGYTVLRKKIETVPWHPAAPQTPNMVMPESCYFEAHFNIEVTKYTHVDLIDILRETDVRLSRNAFKSLDDGRYIMMATLRRYDGTREKFENECVDVVELLTHAGFAVPKTITEFSIFDTKISHDAAWLIQ